MDELRGQVKELLNRPPPEQVFPSTFTDQLAEQITKLQEQVADLQGRPQPEVAAPSAVSDETIAAISDKLDRIIAQEPVV